jgi:hypothetical protein
MDYIYVNSLLYRQGNPFLKPELTDYFSISCMAYGSIFVSVDYSNIVNSSFLWFSANDSILIAKYENIDKQKAGFTTGINYSNGKTSFNISVSLFKSFSEYRGVSFNSDRLGLFLSSTSNIALRGGNELYLSAQYINFEKEDFYQYLPYYNVEIGLRRFFLKKKLRVAVYYKNQHYESFSLVHENIDLEHKYFREKHLISISLKYNFNLLQEIGKTTSSENELNRM